VWSWGEGFGRDGGALNTQKQDAGGCDRLFRAAAARLASAGSRPLDCYSIECTANRLHGWTGGARRSWDREVALQLVMTGNDVPFILVCSRPLHVQPPLASRKGSRVVWWHHSDMVGEARSNHQNEQRLELELETTRHDHGGHGRGMASLQSAARPADWTISN
jgi:hypothetical protein